MSDTSLSRMIAQGTKVQQGTRANFVEKWAIAKLDEKRFLKKYAKRIEKLRKGSLDIPAFLEEISTEMITKLLMVAETTVDEKTLVNVAQDLLDRAGHGKIQKAVNLTGSLDRNATKAELINAVLSMGKQAGMKVKSEETVIDAEPIGES